MSSPQLPNYLKANRKRFALSQDEVALLLGSNNGAQVCRYERFAREPSLATALAYEAIFKRSVSELFSGLYQQVEQEVAERARLLLEKQAAGKGRQRTARRRDALAELANQATS